MAAAFNLTAQINLQGPTNLKPIVSNIKKQLGSIKTDLNIQVKASSAKNIADVTNKLKGLSTAATKANSSITTLNSSLSTLAASFNSIQSASIASVSNINNTTKALKNTQNAVNATRTEIEEFGKQSGLAVRRFAAFSTVTGVVYGLVNAFSTASKEFITFNQEIVRLSQVTGKSVSDLQEVTKEIRRLSTGIGVASTDLLTVSTTLAQAGLSAEDTRIALEALAKSALAPSFDNLNDTTEGSIAILRQFNLQASDLEGALGSVNAVAAAFAVEASDLIAAIQRTGGVFASSSRGVSEGTDALNEFLAVFTSVRATTRESAETIATGLRTIFTRIQRAQTIDQLKEYGIALTDLEGKFVGPFEAVKRLSEGLNQLDPRDIRFSSIVEELGGFRQIGKVIPLIQQFAVAQDALKVAQRGQDSLTQNVATAQQALAVQFTKTRENFLALVAEIGDTSTFKALTNITFGLANGVIDLARGLEPLIPLLTAFATIKIGSSVNQYLTGFLRGFGGGGPGGTNIPVSPTGPAPAPTGAAQSAGSSAIGNNTTALTALSQTISALNQSILALNQNIVNNNSLMLNRPRGFAVGGLVPGRGNRDTYPAMLTPGEFVIRKQAVESIGINNLAQMNSGGAVQKFQLGSPGGVRRGSRSRVKELSQEEIEKLTTQELIKYAKQQAFNVFSTGGSGMVTSMEFVPVPQDRIVPELEQDLTTYLGKKGFWQEKISPFGRSISRPTNITQSSRAGALEKQISKQSDEVAARDQRWRDITSGSQIDNYLLSSLKDPSLSDYKTVRGGGQLSVQYHNTRLRQAVNKALDKFDDFDYSPRNIDKLVSGMAAKRFAVGGLVQKFAQGSPGGVKPLKEEDILEFGLVGLRGGLSNPTNIPEAFSQIQLTPKTQTPVKISVGTLSQRYGDQLGQDLESKLAGNFKTSVKNIANKLAGEISASTISDSKQIDTIINNAGFAGVVGLALESAIGLIGAPFVEKTEKTKSIDFPLGLGNAANLFGIKSDIPTDVTRTIGGYGKSIGGILAQAERFIAAQQSGAFETAKATLASTRQAQSLTPILSEIKSRVPTGQGIAALDPAAARQLRVKYGLSRGGLNISSLESTVTKLPSGQQQNFLDDLSEFLKVRGFAEGGSTQDTVPALLTPGEFVFTKKAAQKIGYSTLNRLNKADKIQGFNKGGIVGSKSIQRFQQGGAVGNIDLLTITSIFTTVLQPQVEKLASSFDKADKQVATFGTALSGAIKETSSLIASAGIGLNVVGASARQKALGFGVAGIGGVVGGGAAAFGSKSLQLALNANTNALSVFEKKVQQVQETTDPTERIKSAQALESEFVKLTKTLSDNRSTVDFYERLSELGDSLNTTAATFLSIQTSALALSSALNSAATSSQVNNVAQQASNIGGLFTSLGSFGGKIQGIITVLPKFLGYIGLAITAFQVVSSVISFFVGNTKRAGEESIRLADALKKATLNSAEFSLANQRYTDNLLGQFSDLRRLLGSRQISEQDFNAAIAGGLSLPQNNFATGSAMPLPLEGIESFDVIISDLNLLLRQQIKTNLELSGIILPFDKSLSEFDKILQAPGLNESLKTFRRVIGQTLVDFNRRQFVKALTEQGDQTVEQATGQFETLLATEQGRQNINKVVQDYVASQLKAKLASDLAASTTRQLTLSLVSLKEVSSNLASRLAAETTNVENSLKKLDDSIGAFTGQPTATGNRQFEQRANILSNVSGFSQQAITQAISETFRSITPNSIIPSDNIKALETETNDVILAFKDAQNKLPTILSALASGNTQQKATDELNESLSAIFSSLKISKDVKSQLIDNITDFIQNAEPDKPILSIDQVIQKFPQLGEAFENAQKLVVTANQEQAKVSQLLAEKTNQLADSFGRLNDIQVSFARLRSDFNTSIGNLGSEIRKILGDNLKSVDFNESVNAELRALTQGLSSGIDSASIGKALQDNIDQFTKQQQGELTSDRERAQTIDNIKRLNKALDILVDPSRKLKNSFEDLIEKEKRLFSGPQGLFKQFLRDPSQAREVILGARSIEAIRSGDTSEATLRTASAFADIVREQSPQTGQRLDVLVAEAFFKAAQQQGLVVSKEIRDALTVVDPNEKFKLLGESADNIRSSFDETVSALRVRQDLENQLNTILSNETDNIRKSYLQNLKGLFDEEINQRNTIINSLKTSIDQRQPILQQRSQLDLSNDIRQGALRNLGPNLTPSSGTSLLSYILGGLSGGPGMMGTSSAISQATNQASLPNEISSLLSTPFKDINDAVNRIESVLNKTNDLNRIQSEDRKLLERQLELLRNELQKTTRPIPSTSPSLSPSRGALLQNPQSSATMDRSFNKFISDFEKSLISQSEQVSTNIVQSLSIAFASLNGPITQFKSTTDNFISKLEQFNATGGIKGPNIPQEVSVSVSFDDTVTVVAERTNSNQTLLEDIGILVNEAVTRQLRDLRVFG